MIPKEFDKQIKGKLNEFESKYSSNIWDNIEQVLEEDKKTRALPYFGSKNFLLLASVLVIFTAVGYNLYNSYSTNLPSPNNKLKITNPNNLLSENKINYENQTELTASVASKAIELPQKVNNIPTTKPGKSNTSTNRFVSTIAENNSNESLIPGFGDSKSLLNESADYKSNSLNESFIIAPQKIMSVVSGSTTVNLKSFFIPDPKGRCPKFYTNVPGYFVELFLSPDFHSSFLSLDDKEMIGYLNSKKQSETALPGYSVSFKVGMEFRNGLLLKSGLTYSDIRYKLDYSKNDVEILKYKVVPSDTIHGNGSVAYVFDTIAYVEKGVRTVRNYNSLKSIEVPFWLGYQKDFTRWTLGFNAGLSLQILSMKSGKVLSPSLPQEPVEFSDSINGHYSLYKRTFGLGLLASTQFGYKITSNYQFMVEPYLKYYPSSVTSNDYPLRQTMLVYGVNLGLRLGF
ncbi:MAG: hypothetical protein JNK41_01770 [Saprospiraceae bacterium]|jgi:hypothetical protein|nr:hypothetical protein [Saprospiraceae bacterium]